jgi:hypothetical protein
MATCFSPYRAIIRPYGMCVQDRIRLCNNSAHGIPLATALIDRSCTHILYGLMVAP